MGNFTKTENVFLTHVTSLGESDFPPHARMEATNSLFHNKKRVEGLAIRNDLFVVLLSHSWCISFVVKELGYGLKS